MGISEGYFLSRKDIVMDTCLKSCLVSDVHSKTSPHEKRTYTVREVQEILSIGKNAAYELVKTQKFKCVKVGNSIRISKKSFDQWLDCEMCE